MNRKFGAACGDWTPNTGNHSISRCILLCQRN
ncbi:hypothetical protein MAR_027312 [Mya arenaria]|uniref:Uncharacterized protein n=1 Tax=Mya arenaria TaxID=6604 RepID=A0ABY7ET39_MYAAR|nr:hypothetical protein MAR_027312 [Mya arenaria]